MLEEMIAINNPIVIGIIAFAAAFLARVFSCYLCSGDFNLIPSIAGAAVFAVVFTAIANWANGKRFARS